MRRPAPAIRLLVLIVAVLAMEPLVHQHSLERDHPLRATAARACPVCATGMVSVPSVRGSVMPAAVMVGDVAAFTLTQPGVALDPSLPSRAPPAR